MRRLFAALLGMVVGGGLMFAAFQFHLVRTDKSVFIVRRQRTDWHDAYADVRGWTHHEWSEHRELSSDMIAAGRGEHVVRSIGDQLFRGLFDSFRESPSGSHPPNAPHSK